MQYQRRRIISDYEVYRSLSRLQKTSPGPDQIPYWIYKLCSYELHHVITHLIKLTITSGNPPPPTIGNTRWLLLYPKSQNRVIYQNFDRSHAVTSILSRVTERIIVKKYLLPSLPQSLLDDQFAYRPTGSTTAVLIVLNHQVVKLLETNSYLRCLMVDFSKAFDK